jgi:hypothetical protein
MYVFDIPNFFTILIAKLLAIGAARVFVVFVLQPWRRN